MTSLKHLALVFLAAAAVAAPDAETMKRGAAAYAKGACIACHQPTGMGLPPVFPPLAGSEWVAKSTSIAIRNILHGMQGPITVKGVPYNSMMPAVTTLSEKEIADVVTFVSNSWGNTGPTVTEDEVKAIKKKYADRKTPWTAAEYDKEPQEAPAKK
jgi:mono/diheme cytochrome c family protein